MAVLFSDDFNRANGALGGAWIDVIQGFSVATNQARPNSLSGQPNVSLNPCTVGQADVTVQALVPSTSSATYNTGLVARSDAAWNNCYYVSWYRQPNVTYLDFIKRVGGSATTLYRVYQVPDNGSDHTLSLTCHGSQHTVTIDGTVWLQFTDEDVPGGSYAGLYGNQQANRFDNFEVLDATGASISLSPPSVQASSVDNTITVAGVNTAWSAGNPGTPTFTVLYGSITAQEVIDEVTAVLTYTAPAYVVTDTVTDPSTGAVAYLTVGAAAPAGLDEVLRRLGLPPTGETISSLGDLLRPTVDRLAAIWDHSTIFSALQTIDPTMPLYDLFNAIQNALIAEAPAVPPPFIQTATTFAVSMLLLQNSNLDRADLMAIRGAAYWTFQELDNDLRSGGLANLDSIYAAITALQAPDLTPITTYLDWITSTQLYKLADIISNVVDLKGAGNRDLTNTYDATRFISDSGTNSLQTVLNAIAALNLTPNVDLTPVTDYLDWMTRFKADRFLDVLNAIAGVRGSGNDDLTGVTANLNAYRTNSLYTVQHILDAINGVKGNGNNTLLDLLNLLNLIRGGPNVTIQNLFDSLASISVNGSLTLQTVINAVNALPDRRPTAPIWPGMNGVTLGAPVDLADGIVVNGPLDGVLVAITYCPNSKTRYGFGGVNSYARSGAVMFVDPGGWAEFPIGIGPEKQVIVPKSMTRAAAARFRVEDVRIQGFVTPWTLTG